MVSACSVLFVSSSFCTSSSCPIIASIYSGFWPNSIRRDLAMISLRLLICLPDSHRCLQGCRIAGQMSACFMPMGLRKSSTGEQLRQRRIPSFLCGSFPFPLSWTTGVAPVDALQEHGKWGHPRGVLNLCRPAAGKIGERHQKNCYHRKLGLPVEKRKIEGAILVYVSVRSTTGFLRAVEVSNEFARPIHCVGNIISLKLVW